MEEEKMASHFIAQALSLYLLVMGVAMLCNKQRFYNLFNDIVNNPSYLVLSGVIALIFGILIVLSHNMWVCGWPLLVTLSGWAAFLKGACLLIVPSPFVSWCKPLFTPGRIFLTGCFLVLLALILGAFGFS